MTALIKRLPPRLRAAGAPALVAPGATAAAQGGDAGVVVRMHRPAGGGGLFSLHHSLNRPCPSPPRGAAPCRPPP